MKQPRKPAPLAASTLAKLPQYMCTALHQIPDDLLLEQSPRDYTVYQPYWVKRGLTALGKGGTCVAYMTKHAIALLPLPTGISAHVAPYILCYDFALGALSEPTPVVSYYGFKIVTTPQHDIQRAQAFVLQAPEEALVCADRALLRAYISHKLRLSVVAEREVERLGGRFRKLCNLYLDQQATPEGTLACARAIETALKCYAILAES